MYEVLVMIRHGDVLLPISVYADIADEHEADKCRKEFERDNPHNQFSIVDADLDG